MAVNFMTPYAMDGTVIPGAGLRRQLQQSAGEGSGVIWPGDLRVSELDVPGPGIKIAAGDDIIQSRNPGSLRESYGVSLPTDGTVDGIPGTGSGGSGVVRRDMVIHEILDPNAAKHFTDPATLPGVWSTIAIVQGVPLTATDVDDVPALADVTAYCLATIDYEASTATITNEMITNRRELHRPKSDRVLRTRALSGVESDDLTATAQPGQTWPGLGSNLWGPILIPSWATHVRGLVRWNGVLLNGDAWGDVWLRIGTGAVRFESTRFDSVASGGNQRTVIEASGSTAIPEAMRGTEQRFYPIGLKNSGSAPSSMVRLDKSSSLTLDVEFYQAAV
ncbi:hypothetical protein MUN78_10155 [Leucobacter allii]|uniref:Phage tail protein n=1 Tax=Leucobacter allii TaxID=2932247 RepID=A0ABY4FKI2_9MICO|nr:hypothetical protein [Leucobacter allii]UOQ56066.1 hypothetical protein MUN78_10155 [Leucobacter allii]